MDTLKNTTAQALKEAFAHQSEKYQHLIDEQLGKVRENATLIGRIALATGVAFAGLYWLTKALSGKQQPEPVPAVNPNLPVVQPSRRALHPVMQIFWESISMFLLSVARQKLNEFLQNIKSEEQAEGEVK